MRICENRAKVDCYDFPGKEEIKDNEMIVAPSILQPLFPIPGHINLLAFGFEALFDKAHNAFIVVDKKKVHDFPFREIR